MSVPAGIVASGTIEVPSLESAAIVQPPEPSVVLTVMGELVLLYNSTYSSKLPSTPPPAL
jgi:hypothetical protein